MSEEKVKKEVTEKPVKEKCNCECIEKMPSGWKVVQGEKGIAKKRKDELFLIKIEKKKNENENEKVKIFREIIVSQDQFNRYFKNI